MKSSLCHRCCQAAIWLGLSLPTAVVARTPQGKSQECLACHGQPGMKSESGRNIYVDPAKRKASAHGTLECTTCHEGVKDYPHPSPMPRVKCATCHSAPTDDLSRSVHAILGPGACASCHGNAHEVQPAARTAPQGCVTCHADAVRDYRTSVHASVLKSGSNDGATCSSCHGPAHRILPSSDPASKVAKKNLPDTCGACHANP